MASVKGLMKGLRYITQMFDQPKEPEMEIGGPTDVKHVAHVGWDGPSPADPSWMSGFKCVQEIASQPSTLNNMEKKNPAKKIESGTGTGDRKTRGSGDKPKQKSRQKSSTNGESILDSPTKRRSDGTKQCSHSVDSPRGMNKSGLPDDQSACQDPACVPKSSRRKKTKVSEGSSRTTKSKGGNSVPDTAPELCSKTDTCQGLKNKEVKLTSVRETKEEERG